MRDPVTIGVSLKTYFTHAAALTWFSNVRTVVQARPALRTAGVDIFVAPTYLQLSAAISMLDECGVMIGAQDVSAEPPGAATGEVSAAELAEIGVSVAEVGHRERRQRYGDTDEVVNAKVRASLANALTPVLCVGETDKRNIDEATATTLAQLTSALRGAPSGRIIVAYEPAWAIGAPEPASRDWIRPICREIRGFLDQASRPNSSVLYGGSAGPGLLASLWPEVDGLFLGRFAHDPGALGRVLDETLQIIEGAG